MELLRRVVLKRPVERVGFIWRIQGREGLQAGDSKDDGYGTRTRRLDCGLWIVVWIQKLRGEHVKSFLWRAGIRFLPDWHNVQIMMYRLDVSMQILGCQTI